MSQKLKRQKRTDYRGGGMKVAVYYAMQRRKLDSKCCGSNKSNLGKYLREWKLLSIHDPIKIETHKKFYLFNNR